MKDKQAEKYLEEAEISLKASRSLFSLEDKDMYAHVVKNCYDAMEQAVSATLAKKDETIPKSHPAKITRFINSYSVSEEIEETLFKWLRKRSFSQYVDIKNGSIVVPHEEFGEDDAKRSISDTERVLDYIRNLIQKLNNEDENDE